MFSGLDHKTGLFSMRFSLSMRLLARARAVVNSLEIKSQKLLENACPEIYKLHFLNYELYESEERLYNIIFYNINVWDIEDQCKTTTVTC